MKTEIRKALDGDIDFIAELEKETFSLPQSKKDFEEMVTSPQKLLLVATLDGERAGYIGAYTVCRESDIMTVAVAERFRQNGIGKMLVSSLFDELSGESDALFLEVRESNLPARRLYSSLGFYEVGKRKAYYKLPTEDAILYKKDL